MLQEHLKAAAHRARKKAHQGQSTGRRPRQAPPANSVEGGKSSNESSLTKNEEGRRFCRVVVASQEEPCEAEAAAKAALANS